MKHITLENIKQDTFKALCAIKANKAIMNKLNVNFSLALLLHKASLEFESHNYELASSYLTKLIVNI